jgi:aspartate racemase
LKKLGIIGGTSWASTALYYDQINRGVAARLGGLHSAPLAIESLDFAPVAAMQRAGDWAGVAEVTIEAARRLRDADCDALLLASNTMHKVAPAVAEVVDLPLIDISEATARQLVAEHRSRIALLGTRFTMTEPFAREAYERHGLSLQPLSEEWQREVDRIIYEELAAGRVVRESHRKLRTLITELGKQKVQAVVLGCTELVLAVDVRANVLPVYDTTAIHARAAVEWIVDGEALAERRAA